MKKIDVEKIIFNGPKTIVLWTDGTKTIVSMSKDEPRFDPEAAFCAAYTKKMYGTNSKTKRVIAEKSNIEKWKELNEAPEDQLYKLGLKALAGCEDIDIKEIECVAKEAEKLQDALVQAMYDVLTGHPYEGEKNEKVETPASYKFKVGDGVAVSSMCSPYAGRGGRIAAITRNLDDGSIRYTVEFYEPGNPGHYLYAYDLLECQLTYDPTQVFDEKTKKMADAWYVFFHSIIDGDDSKEDNDGNN